MLRTLKFSRYLPSFGWIPHVLTLRELSYRVRDDALKAQIPQQAVVHRTLGWDTRHFSIRGRHLQCMAIPDRHISWLPFGIVKGLRVVRRAGVHALFSTSPLPTAHLIAGVLKLRTKLPWIADFRDPWIEEGIHPRPGSSRFRIESRLERFVMHQADRITVTTPEFRGELIARYPELSPEKFSVIFNGFDEEDFRDAGEPVIPSRFEILHAGMVDPDYRNPLPLLRAVASLIEQRMISRQEVRIVFLGGGPYVESAAFRQTVTEFGLTDIVQVLPRISNRDAIRRLREAAVLLLLQGADDVRSLIPAKAFEYLRIGRPILATTLEGATAELIRATRSGIVVPPHDVEGIQRALLDFHSNGWPMRDRDNDRLIRQFERKTLTGELARLLDGLCADGSGTGWRHIRSCT